MVPDLEFGFKLKQSSQENGFSVLLKIRYVLAHVKVMSYKQRDLFH